MFCPFSVYYSVWAIDCYFGKYCFVLDFADAMSDVYLLVFLFGATGVVSIAIFCCLFCLCGKRFLAFFFGLGYQCCLGHNINGSVISSVVFVDVNIHPLVVCWTSRSSDTNSLYACLLKIQFVKNYEWSFLHLFHRQNTITAQIINCQAGLD